MPSTKRDDPTLITKANFQVYFIKQFEKTKYQPKNDSKSITKSGYRSQTLCEQYWYQYGSYELKITSNSRLQQVWEPETSPKINTIKSK